MARRTTIFAHAERELIRFVDALPDEGQLLADQRFAFLPEVFSRRVARELISALEGRMAPQLKRWAVPIPRGSISDAGADFGETLGKTVRMKTATLYDHRSRIHRTASRLGLIRLLQSSALRRLGEIATGRVLADEPELQIHRYGPGDFVGPHTDHFPEDDPETVGYVDIHLSLTKPSVAHQSLVCERGGFLSVSIDVSAASGVGIYHLPFWHYVAPLVGQPGAREEPSRWVLLASYHFAD